MRGSQGQVFVLARDKVADFHTRGKPLEKNAPNAINVCVEMKGDH